MSTPHMHGIGKKAVLKKKNTNSVDANMQTLQLQLPILRPPSNLGPVSEFHLSTKKG